MTSNEHNNDDEPRRPVRQPGPLMIAVSKALTLGLYVLVILLSYVLVTHFLPYDDLRFIEKIIMAFIAKLSI